MYDLEDARDRFGLRAFQFRRLMFPKGFLSPKQAKRLNRQLVRLEERFPDVIFGCFFIQLAATYSHTEFAFWMVNHCALPEDDLRQPENCVFLVIDLPSRTVSVTLGYAVERVLPERDLHRSLREGEMYLCESDFARGVSRIWQRLGQQLALRLEEGNLVPREWIAEDSPPDPSPAQPTPLSAGLGQSAAYSVQPNPY